MVWTKDQCHSFYLSTKWRHFREQILERDHYECQWCKDEGRVTRLGGVDAQGNAVVLEVDHIKTLEQYPELRLDPDNLRTLCKDCHNKRHGRMRWRSNGNGKPTNKWAADERWD
jgi:5-methylcytosine-specific restriction endonuclease McrA